MKNKFKGTVRERNKRYNALFPYVTSTGKRKQVSKTFDTKGQANAWLKEKNNEYRMNALITENPTLEKIYKSWVKRKLLTGNTSTEKMYTNASKVILERLNKPIQNITDNDVVNFFIQLKADGYEPAQYKSMLSSWFNYAMDNKFVGSNLVKDLKISRTNKKREAIVLTEDQKNSLYRYFHNEDKMHLYYPVFFALHNGLRIGEVQGLMWDCVDLENRTYEVKRQYTLYGELKEDLKSMNGYRINYMDSFTLELLQELKKSPYTQRDFVFYEHNKLRGRLSYALGTFNLSSHDLRHTHGTELQDIMPIADAAYRMGHSKAEYVNTYIHPRAEKTREMLEKYVNPKYADKMTDKPLSNVTNLADFKASK